MKERLEPFRSLSSLEIQPHEMRGTYDECRFWAKIIDRRTIDDDPHRNTAQVRFDVANLGLTFIPGDRLAIMPLNSWSDIEVRTVLFCCDDCFLSTAQKIVGALGLLDYLDVNVPLDGPGAAKWKRYARHEAEVSKQDPKLEPRLTVRNLLRKGKVAPLTKEMVMAVSFVIHWRLHES
jgi:hypothetical protein